MIDKSDEYQLVQYILSFKKMQFITAGIIESVIGYLYYFVCANMHEYQSNISFDNQYME